MRAVILPGISGSLSLVMLGMFGPIQVVGFNEVAKFLERRTSADEAAELKST